jgi:hypothetical protein
VRLLATDRISDRYGPLGRISNDVSKRSRACRPVHFCEGLRWRIHCRGHAAPCGRRFPSVGARSGRLSGASLGPVSRTPTRTPSASSVSVLICYSRLLSPSPLIAWMALTIKLTITC